MIIAKDWYLILGVEGAIRIDYKANGVSNVSPDIQECNVFNNGIIATVENPERVLKNNEIEFFLAFKEMELHQRPLICYHISQQGYTINQMTPVLARVLYDLCSIVGYEAKEKGIANVNPDICMEGYREALQDYNFNVYQLMCLIVDSIQYKTS